MYMHSMFHYKYTIAYYIQFSCNSNVGIDG